MPQNPLAMILPAVAKLYGPAVAKIPGFRKPYFYDLAPLRVLHPKPQQEKAIVIDMPHVGTLMPDRLLTKSNFPLSSKLWKQGKDLGIAELLEGVEHSGARCIISLVCRSFVDLNRPKLYSRISNDFHIERESADYEPGSSPNHMHDLGLIWQCFPNGKPIYLEDINKQEHSARIAAVHAPYHKALRHEIGEVIDKFGGCLHLNMHSMPMSQVSAHDPDCDILIGNLHGRSAHSDATKLVARSFRAQGFKVRMNHPFAGGECIASMLDEAGVDSLQLEFNRDKFWDSGRDKPAFGFADFQSRTQKALHNLSAKYPLT